MRRQLLFAIGAGGWNACLFLSPPAGGSWWPGYSSTLAAGHLYHMGLDSRSKRGPRNEEANRTLVWGHLPVGRGRPSSSSREAEKGRLFNKVRRVGQISSPFHPIASFSGSRPRAPPCPSSTDCLRVRVLFAARQIVWSPYQLSTWTSSDGRTPSRFLSFSHLAFSRSSYHLALRKEGASRCQAP